MEMLSLLAGTSSLVMIQAVIVLGIFWAALVHPDKINNILKLRIAMISLGIAIIVPVVVQFALISMNATVPGGARKDLGWVGLITVIPAILTMVALILSIDAVLPRRKYGEA